MSDFSTNRSGRPYVFPVIHLNGNSRESLQEQYKEARKKLGEAAAAYLDIDFHMRNYYPLGAEKMREAEDQHTEMCAKFNELTHYLDAHLNHLYNK